MTLAFSIVVLIAIKDLFFIRKNIVSLFYKHIKRTDK